MIGPGWDSINYGVQISAVLSAALVVVSLVSHFVSLALRLTK